jgi:hypothetical protein
LAKLTVGRHLGVDPAVNRPHRVANGPGHLERRDNQIITFGY